MNSQKRGDHFPLRLIRGGSSKGIFLRETDIPSPGPERDAVILKLFGTPDIRQIDGLGGGDKLTSKLAVMGKALRKDCDVSYLFGQVGTKFSDLDWQSNCGNISAGAALFAALDGLGDRDGATMSLSIEQRNTGRKLLARVPMAGDIPSRTGDFEIGGVPGTGPRIDLDFADFAGSTLNQGLFPTGARADLITLANGIQLSATIIDIANLSVIVAARDLAIDLLMPIDALQRDYALRTRLDTIRAAVAIRLGMCTQEGVATFLRRSVNPFIHIVAPPCTYPSINGNEVKAETQDIWSRSYSRATFSKAFPGSGAVGLAVAARLKGTVANDVAWCGDNPSQVWVGHPGGLLSMEVASTETVREVQVSRAVLGRTARLLLEGVGYA
ncbi:hypothetical protein FZZ93_03125 [Halomonas eurihalina]|uniref:3-methylitaconate isomerase n=1 Tax=Halomonas eurihalina TaxID=42566 RepID=A0A5D9DAB9_HALER|nr:PrpF domain-containing protein [Halomonas eurihalina]MDR5859268.1 PrpF domain-containing protein [Halomonas eurihalina]TZG40908.1 hypothetical protein FZZ93_03125 [Halomonas eurihalina]